MSDQWISVLIITLVALVGGGLLFHFFPTALSGFVQTMWGTLTSQFP